MPKFLRVEEVALLVGVSVKTINNWYAWKKEHPEHERAGLLPDYIQNGNRQKRFWKEQDIWQLVEFQSKLPKGRNGILGDITQKYVKKG